MSAVQQNAFYSARTFQPIVPAPIWQLVLSWAIVIPLFYFSANGTFIPVTANTSLAVSPTSSASHMVQEAFVMLICTILVASRLPYLLSDWRRKKVILALPVLAIVSSLWSVDPRQSVISGVILLVFTAFALYLGERFNSRQQFELIMLLGAIVLPLSIALALFVPALGASEAGWSGIFNQKQNCAVVSMFLLITALHWKGSGVYQKAFRAIYILMCVLLIVMSRSRTGWALALIAILLSGVIWLMQNMPAKESLLITLLGLVVAGGLGYVIYSYSTAIVTSVGKDPTLSQRTSIWAAVWIEILKRPILGYGFAAFWKGLYGPSHDVVVSSGWDVFQAQDGFLDVWLGVGIVGVALVAIMVVQAAKNAIRSFRSENEAYVRWCIVVIICSLLLNIGESTIGRIQMGWLLFLLAYVGLARSTERAVLSKYELSGVC